MKFLSIKTIAQEKVQPLTPKQMESMGNLITEMRSKGVLLETGGSMPGMLQMTVKRDNGDTVITDGPSAESKDLGGFALFDVKDRDEAIAWTNRILDIIPDGTYHIHQIELVP